MKHVLYMKVRWGLSVGLLGWAQLSLSSRQGDAWSGYVLANCVPRLRKFNAGGGLFIGGGGGLVWARCGGLNCL